MMDTLGAIARSYAKRKAAGMPIEWFEQDKQRLLETHKSKSMQNYINNIYKS